VAELFRERRIPRSPEHLADVLFLGPNAHTVLTVTDSHR
jgi:hypothetical protein